MPIECAKHTSAIIPTENSGFGIEYLSGRAARERGFVEKEKDKMKAYIYTPGARKFLN
jgi:hypothetical protein